MNRHIIHNTTMSTKRTVKKVKKEDSVEKAENDTESSKIPTVASSVIVPTDTTVPNTAIVPVAEVKKVPESSSNSSTSTSTTQAKQITHVLSRSMRPTSLDQIIGQDYNISFIKNQFKSERVPHFYIIAGSTGTGKCLGYNTPIIMYDGTIKNIQDIKVNDQIMGDDSKPRNILSVCKGQEQMYKIIQENGDNYITNESHILSLKLGSKIPIKINDNNYKNNDIVDISVKNYLKLEKKQQLVLKGYKVPIYFKEKEVLIEPYTMGYSMLNEDIPIDYKYNSHKVRLELLAGLIDKHGYYYNNLYVIIINSKNLLKDIEFLVRSLGIRTKTVEIINGYYVQKIWPGNCIVPCRLEKINVQKQYHDHDNDNLCTNIKVEPLEPDQLQEEEYKYYYGFEIDGNHRFMLGDCTVTHNTTLSRILAMIFQGYNSYEPDQLKKQDIREVNAANNNGVDYARSLLDEVKYKPANNSKAKVIIMDEAQQLTQQAQDVLLKATEEASDHVFFIFCTSDVTKIKDTLQRRATVIKMNSLSDSKVFELLERARLMPCNDSSIDSEPLYKCLLERDIREPGKILQAYEKYTNGLCAVDCVSENLITTSGLDEKKLIEHIKNGAWLSTVEYLKLVRKDDIYSLRTYICNSLKNKLLNDPTINSVEISNAICIISNSRDELPSFIACIRLACNEIKPIKKIIKTIKTDSN